VTRLTPIWSQSGDYPASTDRQLIRAIWPTGGVMGMTAAIVPETMQIQIAPGAAVIPATEGSWLCVSDAPERVAISTAPPSGQVRADLIVAGPVVDGDDPAWAFQAISGTPTAGTPTVPAAPAGTLPITFVNVLGGTAVLTGGVADRRPNTAAAARGYRYAAQGLAAGMNQIYYDTVDFGSNFDVSQYGYVAPIAGIYAVSAQVTLVAPSGSVMVAQLGVNRNGGAQFSGALISVNVTSTVGQLSGFTSLVGHDLVKCDPGDLLTGVIWVESSGSANLINESKLHNYLSVGRVA
jgi:hypothetical protein